MASTGFRELELGGRVRNKGVTNEGIMKRVKNTATVFPGRRNVCSDVTEGISTFFGSETTGNLLFDFDHPHIPFRLIIVEGY